MRCWTGCTGAARRCRRRSTPTTSCTRTRASRAPPDPSLLELAARDEPYDPVPCHNDLLPANFIATDDGLVLLDWEYAGMGDRRFDLANFAMNTGAPCEHANALTLSLLREAMWGVVQAANSDLDFDFSAYADEHFARLPV